MKHKTQFRSTDFDYSLLKQIRIRTQGLSLTFSQYFPTPSLPIRGQYSGYLITLAQLETSNQVIWSLSVSESQWSSPSPEVLALLMIIRWTWHSGRVVQRGVQAAQSELILIMITYWEFNGDIIPGQQPSRCTQCYNKLTIWYFSTLIFQVK